MAQLPPNTTQIDHPGANTTAEIQVPPKAYLNFTFPLEGAETEKKGDDLHVTMPDGAKVVCLGYYRNFAEGEGPTVMVRGEPNKDLSTPSTPKEHKVEGELAGQTPHQQGEQSGQPTAHGEPAQAPDAAQNANTPFTAQGTSPATTGDGSSTPAPAPATPASSSRGGGEEAGFMQSHGIPALGGLMQGSDMSPHKPLEPSGFTGTAPAGGYTPGGQGQTPDTAPTSTGSLLGNTFPDFGTLPPAPTPPPVTPPVTPPVIDSVPSISPGGGNAVYTLNIPVPTGADPNDYDVNIPNSQYATYTVSKSVVVDPVTGQASLKIEVEYILKDTANNGNPTVLALAQGEKLNDTLKISVQDNAAGTTLVSRIVNFVVEGVNDAPIIDVGIYKGAGGAGGTGYAEIKEDGVVNGSNVATSQGTWDQFASGTDAGTQKGSVTFYVNATDPDNHNKLTYTVDKVTLGGVELDYTDKGNGVYEVSKGGQIYGTFTVGADGKVVFALNNDASDIIAMNAGQSLTLKCELGVKDEYGQASTSNAAFDLVIHGTNDKPVLTVPTTATLTAYTGTGTSGALGEASESTASHKFFAFNESGKNAIHNSVAGSLTGSDVDNATGLTFHIAKSDTVASQTSITLGTDTVALVSNNASFVGTYGTLVLNANGSFTYTENGWLTKDVVGQDTFTVLVRDPNGAFDVKTLTFTVTGLNNEVEIAAAGTTNYAINLREDGVLQGGNNPNTAGSPGVTAETKAVTYITSNVKVDFKIVCDDDPSKGTLTFSFSERPSETNPIVTNSTDTTTHIQTITTAYGTLVLNTLTGDYTYTLFDNATVHALNNTDSLSELFVLNIHIAGVETPTTRDFDVKIGGTNTMPTLTLTHLNLTVTEDAGAGSTATGNYTGSDAEAISTNNTLSYTLIDAKGNKVSIIDTKYGVFRLNDDGTYRYEVDNRLAATQALGRNDSITENYTIRVTDGNGAYNDKVVEVTIKGALDTPVITYKAATIYEDSQVVKVPAIGEAPTLTGDAPTLKTVDTCHKTQYSYALVDGSGNALGSQVGNIQTFTTSLGTIAFNTTTGAYTYTMLEATNLAMQSKNINELFATETFTVRTTFAGDKENGTGAELTVNTPLVIELKGWNDAPVFVNGTGVDANTYAHEVTRAILGAADPFTKNTAHVTDIDNLYIGDTKGTNIGNTQENFCFKVFASNETLLFDNSDADNVGVGAEYVWGYSTQYGGVTIDQRTGQYIYTLDNTLAAVRALTSTSAPLTDTFILTVVDRYGAEAQQVVTITIKGIDEGGPGSSYTNYAFVADTLYVKEDSNITNSVNTGVAKPADGAWGMRDELAGVDPNPTTGATAAIRYCFKTADGKMVQTFTNDYGTLTIDAYTGYYRYTLNNQHSSVQSLAVGAELALAFSVYAYTIVSDGGTGSALAWLNSSNTADTAANAHIKDTIALTIQGTNDAPSIRQTIDQVADPLTLFAGQNDVTTSGSVTASDIDKNSGVGDVLRFNFAQSYYGDDNKDESEQYIRYIEGNGTYGTLTLDTTTGAYTYTYKNTMGSLTGTQTEKFIIWVGDGNGGFAQQEISITLTAANASPVIVSSVVSGTTGTAGWAFAGITVGNEPSATTYAHGTTPVFTVNTADGTILLNGSAVPTGATLQAHIAETQTANTDLPNKITGQLAAWDFEGLTGSRYVITDSAGAARNTVLTNDYGTLEMKNDGTYTFTLNKAKVTYLNEGEAYTTTFYVAVIDAAGNVSPAQALDIVIHGTNDAPVLTCNQLTWSMGANVAESTHYTFNLSDVDNSDILANTLDNVKKGSIAVACKIGTTDVTITESISDTILKYTTDYGVLSFDTSSKQYWFALDTANEDIIALAANENMVLNFSITASDGQAHNYTSATTTLSISIQGVNEAPVWGDMTDITETTSSYTSVDDGWDKENDSLASDNILSISGKLNASDVDNNTTLTYSVKSGYGTTVGDFAFDIANDGTFTYTLAGTTEPFDLKTFSDSFTVTVSDGSATVERTYDVAYDMDTDQLQFQLATGTG